MTQAIILIVEDDALLAMNLQRMITLQGYTVVGPVASGEEAIALLECENVDLVLMDIELAGALNGLETAEHLTLTRDIPIVFLTGFSHDALLDQAKGVAPYGYLIKPVSERELAATIAMSLHRYRLDRQLRESQKALAASEARYRHLFENSPLGIFRTTLDGNVLLLNDEMAKMLGFLSATEAIGACTDLARQLYGEPTCREEFIHLLRTQGLVRNFEHQARKRNGEIIWLAMDARLSLVDAPDGSRLEQVIDGFAQDITERKQVSLALEQSEQRHRHCLESTPYGVFVSNEQGHYLQVNPSACRISGYSEAELLTMGIEDFLFTEDRDTGLDHFQTVLRQGWAQSELPFRNKQGERRWWSVTAVKAADGHYLGFCNDITDQRTAEAALRESETNFRTFFASMNDMCLVSGLDGRILATNEALTSTLGYSARELDTMRVIDLHPPNSRHEATAVFTALLEREVDRCCLPLLTKTGELVPVVSHAWYGSWNGKKCVYGTCRNLAGEQEAEQRFERLFRHSPALMALITVRDRHFVDVNDVWLAKTGYTRDEVIGRTSLEIGLIPFPERQDAVADRLLEEGRIENREMEIRCKDGSLLHGLFSREMVRSQGSFFFLTVIIDITEYKQIQEDKRQLQAQLQHAQKMEAVGTLAGGIAHDFNNILGAIIGYAEIAKEDSPSSSAIAVDIDRILEAGNRAASLVRQILAFSRQKENERILLDPGLIVEEVVKFLRPSLPSIIDMHHRVINKRSVLADPTQLHQVLMNLATNAFHAMEQHGGSLEIAIEDVNYSQADLVFHPGIVSGPFVRFSVTDTGPGIPQEIRDRIFDPYFTTKEAGKGTGMGLAIVDSIVRNSGGFITCDSEPGRGTVFAITLPACSGEVVGTDNKNEPITTGGGSILFVDDEEVLIDIGQTMLERLGYEVTVRTSSLEALTIFQSDPHRFDAVITDQTMPGMTGIDLARRMLQIRPDIPIILCTGYSSHVSEEKVKSLGIQGFAMKPYTRKELGNLIRKILRPA